MRSIAGHPPRRDHNAWFDAPWIVALESMALLLFIVVVWFVTIPFAAALAAVGAARRRFWIRRAI